MYIFFSSSPSPSLPRPLNAIRRTIANVHNRERERAYCNLTRRRFRDESVPKVWPEKCKSDRPSRINKSLRRCNGFSSVRLEISQPLASLLVLRCYTHTHTHTHTHIAAKQRTVENRVFQTLVSSRCCCCTCKNAAEVRTIKGGSVMR